MNQFKVGDKVVCVDPYDTHVNNLMELEKDRVYTVRWVGVYDLSEHQFSTHATARLHTTVCVKVEGVRGRGFDTPFYATRFRPVVKKEEHSGMDVLRRIATDPQAPVQGDEADKKRRVVEVSVVKARRALKNYRRTGDPKWEEN